MLFLPFSFYLIFSVCSLDPLDYRKCMCSIRKHTHTHTHTPPLFSLIKIDRKIYFQYLLA